MANTKKAKPTRARKLPGVASVYRGKVRQRLSHTYTPEGLAAIEANTRRLGMSRSDLSEGLQHLYGGTVTREAILADAASRNARQSR